LSKHRGTSRPGRVLGAALFLGLGWFFGGLAGLAICAALVLVRLRGARPGFFWGLGVTAVIAVPIALLAQGLPLGVAGPSFASKHWAATVAAGIALSSLAYAALLEIPAVRGSPAEPEP
jgi:hypothetical protein